MRQISPSCRSLNFICFQWIQFKFCVHFKVLETTNININIRELLPNTKWTNKWLQTRSRYSYYALKNNSGKIFFGQLHPYSRYSVQNSVKGYPRWRNLKKERAKEVLQWFYKFTSSEYTGTDLTCQVPAPKGWKNPDLFILSILNKWFLLQVAAARNKLAEVPAGERKPHKSCPIPESGTVWNLYVALFLKKYSKFWRTFLLLALIQNISLQSTHANGILAKKNIYITKKITFKCCLGL